MSDQCFKLESVPCMAWDFTCPRGHRHDKVSMLGQADDAQTRTTPVDVSRPALPLGYHTIPPEIQTMIWRETLRKPGVHFFVVHVSVKDKVYNSNEQGIRMIELTEPCHKVAEVHSPYRSYFPKGMRSAYYNWRDLSSTYPFGKEALVKGLIEPLAITTVNGFDVTVDAATDVLYLKFLWRASSRSKSRPQYMPTPAYWMLILDNTYLKGIRHVAFEMTFSDECIFWPSDVYDVCGFCDQDKDEHDNVLSTEIWLLADFLHCFMDLETVYVVFPEIKQGPVDLGRDQRYTISGKPDVHAIEEDPTRWDGSPDPVFRCAGGSLRELRGSHVVLPVAHMAEALHAYYFFHAKTAIGDTEAVSTRHKVDRMKVQFKLATLDRDEEE